MVPRTVHLRVARPRASRVGTTLHPGRQSGRQSLRLSGASPVTITVRTPSVFSSVTKAAESSRAGSLSAINPRSCIAAGGPAAARRPKPLRPPVDSPPRARGVVKARRRRRHGKRALDDAQCSKDRIRNGRLGHLGCRIERHEKRSSLAGLDAPFCEAAERIAPSTGVLSAVCAGQSAAHRQEHATRRKPGSDEPTSL